MITQIWQFYVTKRYCGVKIVHQYNKVEHSDVTIWYNDDTIGNNYVSIGCCDITIGL